MVYFHFIFIKNVALQESQLKALPQQSLKYNFVLLAQYLKLYLKFCAVSQLFKHYFLCIFSGSWPPITNWQMLWKQKQHQISGLYLSGLCFCLGTWVFQILTVLVGLQCLQTEFQKLFYPAVLVILSKSILFYILIWITGIRSSAVYFWKVSEVLNLALAAFQFCITPCSVLLCLNY